MLRQQNLEFVEERSLKIELIVPVAPDGGKARPLSGRIAGLREKVIGLWDNNWSSYDIFSGSVARLLGEQDKLVAKRIPNLPRHSMWTAAELDALAGQIDTAIVGLGA